MTVNSEHIPAFRGDLLQWFRGAARQLPWRETSDPYLIWISEIMLQQTRVDQALPYYERFVERFPDVRSLAESSLDEVLQAWEGLGYYSRARNLHKAALEIVTAHSGIFPKSADEARRLPGIGAYTAAAVTSIAFGEPTVAVDGNVLRVMARVFAIEDEISSSKTRRAILDGAQELLDPTAPGDFNEAMMELGATVCTPRNPDCGVCPLRSVCLAHLHNMTELLPVVAPRKPTPHRDVAVGIVRRLDGEGRDQVLLVQRSEERLLGGLWEFPGGSVSGGESLQDACRRGFQEKLGLDVNPAEQITQFDHQFSHFRMTMHVFECAAREPAEAASSQRRFAWTRIDDLEDFAMHKSARRIADLLADKISAAT